MIDAAIRFAAPSAARLFVGVLPDGGNVFEHNGSILVVDGGEAGDYSSMPLDLCIDCLPPESRLHQAAMLYLEGPTPSDGVSGMTPTNTGANEMVNAKLISRTTIVETYIEITPAHTPEPAPATATVRVVEPASIPAPEAKPAPAIGGPAIGDRVLYTSKAGRSAEYRVFWVGTVDREGEVVQRVGLKRPYTRGAGKGFFVDAAACEFLRNGR